MSRTWRRAAMTMHCGRRGAAIAQAAPMLMIGVAQQMGSKRAFVPHGWSRPILTDTNRNLKGWQVLVTEGASHAIQRLEQPQMCVGSVRLTIAFYLPRPTCLPRRIKAPDLDKLVRATADALMRLVFADDSQIVDLIAMKRYAMPSESPHAVIRVEPCDGVVPPAPMKDQPAVRRGALMATCHVGAPSDDSGNIYPSKRRSRGRIDPVMAILNARKLAVGVDVADDPLLVTA